MFQTSLKKRHLQTHENTCCAPCLFWCPKTTNFATLPSARVPLLDLLHGLGGWVPPAHHRWCKDMQPLYHPRGNMGAFPSWYPPLCVLSVIMFMGGFTPSKHDFSCFFGISIFRFFQKMTILSKMTKNVFFREKPKSSISVSFSEQEKMPFSPGLPINPSKRVVKNRPIFVQEVVKNRPKRAIFPTVPTTRARDSIYRETIFRGWGSNPTLDP